eukprot:jgi/Mesvir1/13406/Mv16492-RA.1
MAYLVHSKINCALIQRADPLGPLKQKQAGQGPKAATQVQKQLFRPVQCRLQGSRPFVSSPRLRGQARRFPVQPPRAIGSDLGGVVEDQIPSPSVHPGVDKCPHILDYIPDHPMYASPLIGSSAHRIVKDYFINENDAVTTQVTKNILEPYNPSYFVRAGPREKVAFNGEDVHAAIVTCGGLCPGLNTVIRELVCGLWGMYGVRRIYGVQAGYRGFYANNMLELNPRVVSSIHRLGGTFLGSSRGGHDTKRIVDAIQDRGINQVYIVGGDGTQRGALAIFREIVARKLPVSVAGIPKTIDNDIDIIDKSFGFDTAVEEAQRAIAAAHVEAESYPNGIGLVKLMGRHSGFIAMHATLASRDVDCCLIPEVPFYLEGPGGLFEFLGERVRKNGHAVIVVAEGAGQEHLAAALESAGGDAAAATRDDSGNQILKNIGLFLEHRIKDHFAKPGSPLRGGVSLKYIDPTYMVRAVRPNASDNVYCTLLAHASMHGAFAGFTGFVCGPVNGRHAFIPIERCVAREKNVNVHDRMWARLMSSTGQPDWSSRTPKSTQASERMIANEDPAIDRTGTGSAPGQLYLDETPPGTMIEKRLVGGPRKR